MVWKNGSFMWIVKQLKNDPCQSINPRGCGQATAANRVKPGDQQLVQLLLGPQSIPRRFPLEMQQVS